MPGVKGQTKEEIAELKDKAVLNASAFYHYKLIARSIGRDEDTILLWRKADSDFSDKLEMARAEFIKKHMSAAKSDFLLERLEKEIFGQKITVDANVNPVGEILEKYGLKGGGNDRQNDEPVSSSSEGSA